MQTKAVTILGMCISFLLIANNSQCAFKTLVSIPVCPVNTEYTLTHIGFSEIQTSSPIPQPVLIKCERTKVLIIQKKYNVSKRVAGIKKQQRNSISDEECLARIIYYEARNQSTKGKMAVADVTLNRTMSPDFPDSVCGVVTQDKQYSGFRIHSIIHTTSQAQKAWDESKRIAAIAIDNRNTVLDSSVLYFHTTHVNPSWKKKMRRVARIDDHVFYK